MGGSNSNRRLPYNTNIFSNFSKIFLNLSQTFFFHRLISKIGIVVEFILVVEFRGDGVEFRLRKWIQVMDDVIKSIKNEDEIGMDEL